MIPSLMKQRMDKFRPGFYTKEEKVQKQENRTYRSGNPWKKTYFKWWYYEIPEERVKELESMHNLMMCEVFLRLGITLRLFAVARSKFTTSITTCEEESTGRSKGSQHRTKPKVVSKQLSNSMFGIETIPKVSWQST